MNALRKTSALARRPGSGGASNSSSGSWQLNLNVLSQALALDGALLAPCDHVGRWIRRARATDQPAPRAVCHPAFHSHIRAQRGACRTVEPLRGSTPRSRKASPGGSHALGLPSAGGKHSMDQDRHLESVIETPDLASRIRGGKYSRWVDGLDVSGLEVLLSAIGVLGEALAGLKRAGVAIPVPPRPPGVSPIERRCWAIHCLAELHRTGRLEWRMPSGWDLQFSDAGHAFNLAFRLRLSLVPNARWAMGLSDRSLAHVLSEVGGFCIRATGGDEDVLHALSGSQKGIDEVRTSLVRIAAVFRACRHRNRGSVDDP